MTANFRTPSHRDFPADSPWRQLTAPHERICLRLFLDDDSLAAVEAVPLRADETDAADAQRRERAQLVMEPRVGPQFSVRWMDKLSSFWLALPYKQRCQLIKRCPADIVAYDSSDWLIIRSLAPTSSTTTAASSSTTSCSAVVVNQKQIGAKKMETGSVQVDGSDARTSNTAHLERAGVDVDDAAVRRPLIPQTASMWSTSSVVVGSLSSPTQQSPAADADVVPVQRDAQPLTEPLSNDEAPTINEGRDERSSETSSNVIVPPSITAFVDLTSSSTHSLAQLDPPPSFSSSLADGHSPSSGAASPPSSLSADASITSLAPPPTAASVADPLISPSTSLIQRVSGLARELQEWCSSLRAKEDQTSARITALAQRETDITAREEAVGRREAEIAIIERAWSEQVRKDEERLAAAQDAARAINTGTSPPNTELTSDKQHDDHELQQLRAQLDAAQQSRLHNRSSVEAVTASPFSAAAIINSSSFALRSGRPLISFNVQPSKRE